VAVDALGRPESFDPSADPVIRVVANRLRKALDSFYEERSATVPVHIMLVRGSYRPSFQAGPRPANDDARATAAGRKAPPSKPVDDTVPQRELDPARPDVSKASHHVYLRIIGLLATLLVCALVYIGWTLIG